MSSQWIHGAQEQCSMRSFRSPWSNGIPDKLPDSITRTQHRLDRESVVVGVALCVTLSWGAQWTIAMYACILDRGVGGAWHPAAPRDIQKMMDLGHPYPQATRCDKYCTTGKKDLETPQSFSKHCFKCRVNWMNDKTTKHQFIRSLTGNIKQLGHFVFRLWLLTRCRDCFTSLQTICKNLKSFLIMCSSLVTCQSMPSQP